MLILPPPNPVLQSRFQGSASLRTGCSVSFKSSKAPNGHLPDRCFRHLSSPASFTTELCAPSGPELGPLYSTFTHTRRPAFLLLASLWYGSPNSERGGIPRVRRQRLLVVVPFVAFGPFSAFHESQVYRSVPARRSTRLLDGFGTNQSLPRDSPQHADGLRPEDWTVKNMLTELKHSSSSRRFFSPGKLRLPKRRCHETVSIRPRFPCGRSWSHAGGYPP